MTILHDYQKRTLAEFFSLFDVENKSVLEVGGIPPFSIAKFFMYKGAKNVDVININNFSDYAEANKKIQYYLMDARRMAFPDKSFDVIFGVAILEHINNLDMFFAECSRVLKPGGFLYLHGGPLWSSYVGHHVYLTIDNTEYKFLENNPIQPWDHLLLDKDEMYIKINRQISNSLHSTKIVNQVYESSFINRVFPEKIIEDFQKSNLAIIDLKLTKWRAMPIDIKKKLIKKYPQFINFNVDDIVIFAKNKILTCEGNSNILISHDNQTPYEKFD
jgi:SAM-dependent methyltransferase